MTAPSEQSVVLACIRIAREWDAWADRDHADRNSVLESLRLRSVKLGNERRKHPINSHHHEAIGGRIAATETAIRLLEAAEERP